MVRGATGTAPAERRHRLLDFRFALEVEGDDRGDRIRRAAGELEDERAAGVAADRDLFAGPGEQVGDAVPVEHGGAVHVLRSMHDPIPLTRPRAARSTANGLWE